MGVTSIEERLEAYDREMNEEQEFDAELFEDEEELDFSHEV